MNIQELREVYRIKTGKNAFNAWTESELLAKIERAGNPKPETPVVEPDVKATITTTSTDVPVDIRPPVTTESDRIARLEKMVESLSKDNSNLRAETAKLQEGWAEYIPPISQNKTATLKVYREDADSPAGVIIKCTTFKHYGLDEETHKRDKLILSLTVLYDDNTQKELKIDAVEFSKLQEIEKVEIIKEDRRTLRKIQDYVILPNRDKEGYPKRILSGGGGYGTSIGNAKVPLEVFMVKSTVVVKRRNGQEITMEADALNL